MHKVEFSQKYLKEAIVYTRLISPPQSFQLQLYSASMSDLEVVSHRVLVLCYHRLQTSYYIKYLYHSFLS